MGWHLYSSTTAVKSPNPISSNSSAATPQSSESQPNSNTPGSSSAKYKSLMSKPYQQTLQTMQNVKSSTLALQAGKISLSAYKSSILKAQATFTSAQAFVQANPTSEDSLKPSYQEFLAGISLANQAMSTILNGVSSSSLYSSLYAAHAMGKKAQQQVIEAYAHF